VQDGVITRDSQVRLLRDNTVIFTGKIGSLRRFKDDVSEVKIGFECGIGIANYRRYQAERHNRKRSFRSASPAFSRAVAAIGVLTIEIEIHEARLSRTSAAWSRASRIVCAIIQCVGG